MKNYIKFVLVILFYHCFQNGMERAHEPYQAVSTQMSGCFVGTPIKSLFIFPADKGETIEMPTTCDLSYLFIAEENINRISSETLKKLGQFYSNRLANQICLKIPYFTHPLKPSYIHQEVPESGYFVGTPQSSLYIFKVKIGQIPTLPSACPVVYRYIPNASNTKSKQPDSVWHNLALKDWTQLLALKQTEFFHKLSSPEEFAEQKNDDGSSNPKPDSLWYDFSHKDWPTLLTLHPDKLAHTLSVSADRELTFSTYSDNKPKKVKREIKTSK